MPLCERKEIVKEMKVEFERFTGNRKSEIVGVEKKGCKIRRKRR